MTDDDVYRPPATEWFENHSTFSPEEWRYMARVFALWFFGSAILVAVVATWQMQTSLSAFGGDEYLPRVMTLAIVGEIGAGLVIASAGNTLVMVTERRAKRAELAPVQRLPWSIVGGMGSATPIAMVLILGLSLAISTFLVGIPWDTSWSNVRASWHWDDVAISILSVIVGAVVLVANVSQVMRVLFRFRGWLILKLIVMSQALGLLLYLVQVMGRALFK
jgi:hypothetical protein